MNAQQEEIIDYHEPVTDFVEVELKDPEKFLMIKEVLTRIGVANKKEKNLYQSCHILHKQGKYYITHFKEMFLLDGKRSTLTKTDLKRRDVISKILEEWNLLTIKSDINPDFKAAKITIISHKDKSDWNLISKYEVGNIG